MTTWIEKIHKSRTSLSYSAYRLSVLANAFAATGNSYMAEQLSEIADDIEDESENIGAITGEHVGTEYRAAQQSAANVLNAIFAYSMTTQETQP